MYVTVDLAWDQNPSSDLAGYKISWGAGSGRETMVLVQADVLSMQVLARATPGTLLSFHLQAFDMASNETARKTIKTVYIEE